MNLLSLWKRCQEWFLRGGRFLTIGQVILIFLVGYFVHWIWSASEPMVQGTPSVPGTSQTEQAGKQKWTCSMHPQIQKDGPGKCPICGMNLIPVTSGQTMGLRFLPVTPEARELMDIEVTPAERRFVDAEIRMVGKVEYDETRLMYITAWVAGRLDRLFVDYTGVQVKKDDHMVLIYSEELYAAQQELIEAKRSARRRKSPLDSGGIDLLASAREKLRLLGLTKEQIADIEKQDKPSDHLLINAPMGGTVVQKLRQQGDRVKVGDRIYAIADLTQVWVMLDAYEADLEWIRYGQRVEITTEAYPDMEPLEGRIVFIHPVLNDKTRTVKVRVNVDNRKGLLKPEMFVHGLVRAKVAGRGRVIDPRLAGKWISPMHPEIVRDKPGKCPICGMDLVPAESLGYAALSRVTPPLVIPVSAVLKTGTRAVVYVELPRFPRELLEKYQHLVNAMVEEDIKKIHAAFQEFYNAVDKPNTLLRTLYALRLWKKYAGRLKEEAAAGMKAADTDAAQLAFDATKRAFDRLQEHFSPSDRPTFAGREIVLGPRAGDYYLVSHGLSEGELVVMRGNFKIDSALQIKAKPSMMTPEGGGVGGHSHGGGGKKAPSAGGKKPPAGMSSKMTLPLAMRKTLHHLLTLGETLRELVQKEDLRSVRLTFQRMDLLLREIDDDLVEGHARLVWNELKMLLGNDLYEGSHITRLDEARRVLLSLRKNLSRLNAQFGITSGDLGPVQYKVSPQFQQQLSALWKIYIQMAEALAKDDAQTAARLVKPFQTALKQVDMKLLTNQQAHMAWMRELENLRNTLADFATAKDLKEQRISFARLSQVMQVLAVSFGFGQEQPVYQHHCEMAFDKKGAFWLQPDDKTRNPYFGSTMLRCAQQVQLIAGKKPLPAQKAKQ